MSSQKLYDPCSGQEIFVNTVDLALDLCFGCGKDGVGLTPESLEDAYYDALEGVDKIIIDPMTCKNVKCITSKLVTFMELHKNSPFFSFLCNDSNLDYTISSGTITQGDGVSTIKGITLNSSTFCDPSSDPVNLAETILHESIHTAFFAIDYFLKSGKPTDPTILNFYNILVAPAPSGFDGNHHEFMAWHVNETAKVLWELNGKLGNETDYYGLIWAGLSQGAGFDPITSNLFNLYLNEVMNVPGNNPLSYSQNQWIQSQHQIYLNNIKPYNKLKFDCP